MDREELAIHLEMIERQASLTKRGSRISMIRINNEREPVSANIICKECTDRVPLELEKGAPIQAHVVDCEKCEAVYYKPLVIINEN